MTHIETLRNDDVATIRFSSEKGVQVFSSAVVEELEKHVKPLAEDRAVRFVVLRGSGKTFLAGADIKEMSGLDVAGGRAFAERGHRVFNALERLPQPTFALLNGHALGGGCEVSLACDFRFAVRTAKLGQPESRLGLIPGWGGTLRLPRLVGRAAALKLMFGGEQISAEEALRIGLVDELADDEPGLDAALERWTQALRGGAPQAIARIKQALRSDDEIGQFAACFGDDDGREGMAAFVAKRAARWMPA